MGKQLITICDEFEKAQGDQVFAFSFYRAWCGDACQRVKQQQGQTNQHFNPISDYFFKGLK
jgi:hypothetical protein